MNLNQRWNWMPLATFSKRLKTGGENLSDLEAGDRVRAAFSMSTALRDLEQIGFWAFGGRETRRLEGGVGPPSAFPVAIIRVLRSSSLEIKVDHSAGIVSQGNQAK